MVYGALGGFVIPPLVGFTTGQIGGDHAYSLGFLPFAVVVLLAVPVVYWLSRWSAQNVRTSERIGAATR